MEAASTPLKHHYHHSINYHLIGAHSHFVRPGSFMCRIQVFNNLCPDFILLVLRSWLLSRQGVDRERETKHIWIEHGRCGRDSGKNLRRHKKADLVIVKSKSRLSCNEARAARRGRFLSTAPSSFFSSVTEMWWWWRGTSSLRALRRLVRALKECAPLTA